MLALAPASVSAQRRASWSLRADNDVFNFWQKEDNRPDREYTFGHELGVALPIQPHNLPRFFPRRLICRSLTERCPWAILGLIQEAYTPWNDAPELQPGERPYAGWLAFQGGIARETRRGMEEFNLAVGVTGPPSLAEFFQTSLHTLFHMRKPLGWSGQLPAEPGVQLTYLRAQELWRTGPAAPFGIRLGVSGRARLGTIHVDGTAGATATIGIRPSAPRSRDLSARSGGFALYLKLSGQVDGILRNEFIQGTLFRKSPGLPLRHVVPEGTAGLYARLGRIELGWSATSRGREYPTQPGAHTWSSLSARILP